MLYIYCLADSCYGVVMVSTASKILICLIFFRSNIIVVRIYLFCHIIHTTPANFHAVFIKYFVILMIFPRSVSLKVWINVFNIGFYIFGKGKIVPYDDSGTAPLSSWWYSFFWTVFDILIKTRTVNGALLRKIYSL